MSKNIAFLSDFEDFEWRIGHIENNGFKMSTKRGYPWTSEKDNFVYVQNTS